MSISVEQKLVAAFIESHQMEAGVEARLIDLVAEVGELAKANLDSTKYGRTSFKVTPNWEEELGDVLFPLLCLANSTGVNLHDALLKVIRKYNERIARKGHPGEGV
jgi:NTP pyrophosphatase (non-canonical NTP hydrolase)